MKCTIDRIDEGIAVLIPRQDPLQRITVPAAILPAGCREGDILTMILKKDHTATATARDRVSRLVKNLRKTR